MREGPILDCRKQLREAVLKLLCDLMRDQSRLEDGHSSPASLSLKCIFPSTPSSWLATYKEASLGYCGSINLLTGRVNLTSPGIGADRLECRESGRLALVTSSSSNHHGIASPQFLSPSIRCLKMGFTKASTVSRTCSNPQETPEKGRSDPASPHNVALFPGGCEEAYLSS